MKLENPVSRQTFQPTKCQYKHFNSTFIVLYIMWMFFRYSKYQLNKMSGQPPPQQQQKIDDDYELWDPRNREDTRIGKGFVVNIALILLNMYHKIMASHFSVCWCCSGSRSSWIHGQKLQEQTCTYQTFSLPHSHKIISTGISCW